MRWGSRKKHAEPAAQCAQEDEEGGRGGKGKARAFSFSPLSWLAKLAPKEKPAGAAAKRAHEDSAATAPAFPSCGPKRAGPSPVAATQARPCSPPRRRCPDAAADPVPRRLSVGNDNADAAAARRLFQSQHRRRHCSLGGDRELPPLGHLIPFSHAASPARAPAAAAAPSGTDAGAARARRRHRRRRSGRRLSVSGGGGGGRLPSFSGGRTLPPPRVRVRSPRAVEALAVVRRTRDPQRAFRESMVEMIASTGGGAAEVERLLARYLSLNADEHHDCIVKVFRQVWFEYVHLLMALPGPPAARR